MSDTRWRATNADLPQTVFTVIGTVTADQGQWWNRPLNVRFIS